MKQKALLLLLCAFCYFQGSAQIKVTGKVTDATTKETLIGVSVKIKNSATGTQTDVNGNYAFNVPPNSTLVFSYLGYKSQEVVYTNQAQINISLLSALNELDQVVVIGYGSQRKRDLTGSITSVSGEDISKSPNTNPLSSLQGRVSGLTLVNSGVPGEGPTLRLRGVISTNSSKILYVVDGVFQDNVDYLNSDDIESIEVLKDPSSIAIFGIQGGSGVIVITTKRAAKGKTRITFQSTVGVQTVPNQIEVADGDTFKRLYSAQLTNIGGEAFDYRNYNASTNWQDLILRDASLNTNNLSISKSGESSTTLINLGYSNQDGVVRNSGFKKYTARLNQEFNINKNIKIGGDINAFHYDRNPTDVTLNNALWAAPIVPVQFDENTYYSMPSFQRAQVGNPIATLNRNDNTSVNKGYRAVANLFAEIKFLKDFKLRSAVYTDLSFNGTRDYSALPYSFINLGETYSGVYSPTDTTYDASIYTSVAQRQDEFRKYQQDHTVTYDHTFNELHKVTALVGLSSLYTGSTTLNAFRRDNNLNIPNDPDFWYLGVVNNSSPSPTAGGGGAESSQMSYFGRVNYAFNNKYLVNTSIRRDGISKFAPQNRWGTFGSLGLGWVISEESFFKDVKSIDFLKLRAAWGTIGNANGFGENLYLPGLNTSDVGVFGDNVYPSVSPAYIPDPNLHWEVVRGFDLGIDFSALGQRLTGDIAVYDRTTKDILTYVEVPNDTKRLLTNLGTIKNRGVEVNLGFKDKIGDDFTYSINPNFSYNKNNVESIGDGFNFQLIGNGGANKTNSGSPIGYFYGYRQIGIYQTFSQMANMAVNSDGTSAPGDIAYEDVNEDGVITEADRVNLGNPVPDWNYGVSVNLAYKNFDVLAQGQGVAGNYVYTQRRTSRFAVINYESNRANAWTGPGTSNVEPILDNTRPNNYVFSNHYLEPGDYFRIRTLQLGYTFNNNKTLQKVAISNLRLYLSGQNLKTWSKTTGYSPEVPISSILGGGADNGVYPIPAVYTFGVNVTF